MGVEGGTVIGTPMNDLVAAQYQWHRWLGRGRLNPGHTHPFSQCLACLRNLYAYETLGAEAVRVMREYAEEPA